MCEHGNSIHAPNVLSVILKFHTLSVPIQKINKIAYFLQKMSLHPFQKKKGPFVSFLAIFWPFTYRDIPVHFTLEKYPYRDAFLFTHCRQCSYIRGSPEYVVQLVNAPRSIWLHYNSRNENLTVNNSAYILYLMMFCL